VSTATRIEWTEVTWNPTTGCDRISPGCDHSYALTLAKRLKAMGQPKYQRDGDPRTSGPGFGFTMHADVLAEPLRWRTPRKVFVNSTSDLSGGIPILISSFRSSEHMYGLPYVCDTCRGRALNKTPAIRRWAQRANVELCFTPPTPPGPTRSSRNSARCVPLSSAARPPQPHGAGPPPARLPALAQRQRPPPDVLAAQRRERARIPSERQQRWERPKIKAA
jgi:Protein of unknown function (DUF5131)